MRRTNGRAGSRAPELSKIRVKGPEFEYYGQALQAAADGVGVAIGISPYVDDDLKAGRLVAPFAQSVSKGEHWYLIYRDGRGGRSRVQAFRAWIMRAAAKGVTATALGLGLTGLPRGESLLDMHFDMKALRAAPVSFWSSAPNLQVSIFCFDVAAKAGRDEQK